MTTPEPSGQPLPAVEYGTYEVRLNLASQDIELWIGNRRVHTVTSGSDLFHTLAATPTYHAYDADRLPTWVTLFAQEVPGLPTEEQWAEMDRRRAASGRAEAAEDTADTTDPPAGDDSGC